MNIRFVKLLLLQQVVILYLFAFYPDAFAEEQEKKGDNLITGSSFVFGHYEQDNNLDNGQEPLEWIVLEVEEEKALILSKYGLDAVQFYDKVTAPDNPVTWKKSSIRLWLNQGFYESAFSEAEKERVISSFLDNDFADSDEVQTEITEDRVFILSVDEVKEYMNQENRPCQATLYAKSKKIWIGYDGNCWWWLRTPGEQHGYVTHMGTEGDLHVYGNRATAKDGTVRPALWIKLNKD